MNKKKLFGIAYLSIGVLLVIVAYLMMHVQPTKSETMSQSISSKTSFGISNYSELKVDTFKMLLQVDYGSLVTFAESNNQLIVQIKDAKQKSFNFYNSNNEILKFKLSDFGFEIKHDTKTLNLEAIFKIQNNAINVPNDVLIQLTKQYHDLKPNK